MLQPTMHKPYSIGQLVKSNGDKGIPAFTGRIAGIAYQHIFFAYIIILDKPMWVEERQEFHEAISVPGSLIEV